MFFNFFFTGQFSSIFMNICQYIYISRDETHRPLIKRSSGDIASIILIDVSVIKRRQQMNRSSDDKKLPTHAA